MRLLAMAMAAVATMAGCGDDPRPSVDAGAEDSGTALPPAYCCGHMSTVVCQPVGGGVIVETDCTHDCSIYGCLGYCDRRTGVADCAN